jgi:hypothetical protein
MDLVSKQTAEDIMSWRMGYTPCTRTPGGVGKSFG